MSWLFYQHLGLGNFVLQGYLAGSGRGKNVEESNTTPYQIKKSRDYDHQMR